MSRFCKEHVWKILIFLVDWRCQAVKRGIIGRLGKVFGVALSFFWGCRTCHSCESSESRRTTPGFRVPSALFRAGCEMAMVDDAYVAEDMYNDRLAYIYDYGEAVPTEALQLLMAWN